MATKQEIAESLTVSELREFAEQEDIDLGGATVKSDIVDRVVSGSTASALSAYAFEGEEGEEREQRMERGEKPAEEENMVGPAAAKSTKAGKATQGASAGTGTYLTPEQQLEQGVSPADLEIQQAATGESRIVKANPEVPTQSQVEAAEVEHPGPPEVLITVDGEEVELPPDEAARAASLNPAVHPGNAQEGYWSNPNQANWQTDEDAVKANEEAYAARVVPAE